VKLSIGKLTSRTKLADQRGLASIIIVFMLIIIVTLITVGFSRLMNRALQVSVNKQLSASADYAAQSGINDAVAYVQANPTKTVSQCGELITSGGTGLRFGDNGEATADLSLSGDQSTRYTCVLIDPAPGDVVYQALPPYESQVVKLNTASPPTSLMFSWRSGGADSSKREFVTGGLQNFLDENLWGTRSYAPVLRISLFPVNSSGLPVPTPASVRTYYLYPNSGSSTVGAANYSTDPTGSIRPGNCDVDPATPTTMAGGFPVGSADYDCNTVITNIPALPGGYYYAKLTPLYNQTDVKIQANNGAAQIKFQGVQSVVDVTAKANSAVKRLQARVATGGESGYDDNNLPESAIRSADAICKRIIVPSSNPDILQIDNPNNVPSCNHVSTTQAPTVTLVASPASILAGESSNLTWTTSNNPTSCNASGEWGGSKAVGGGTESTGALSAGTYTYTIVCSNLAGTSPPSTATVTVTSPPSLPPTVDLTATPETVITGGNSDLRWTVTGATSCVASNDSGLTTWDSSTNPSPAGGSKNTGPLNTTKTYTFVITCSNALGPATDNAIVTASSSGNQRPDARIRSGGCWRTGANTGRCEFYADHAYNGCWAEQDVGSTAWGSAGWPGANPSDGTDNNVFIAFDLSGVPSTQVGYELRCTNNWSTSNIVTGTFLAWSNPPPPPPQCPSPPGSGPCSGPVITTDVHCHNNGAFAYYYLHTYTDGVLTTHGPLLGVDDGPCP